MVNVLITRSIFCPDSTFYNVSINSIFNTLDFIEQNTEHNFKLLVIGWCKKKSYIDTIQKLARKYSYIKYYPLALNYGKYKILNIIKDNVAMYTEYKYMLYADHDIELHTHCNYLGLLNVFENNINDKLIDFISFNHTGDVRHQYAIYDNQLQICDTTVCYPSHGNIHAIATGAYLCKTCCFIDIAYFDMVSAYGLDDYFLIKNISERGFFPVVSKDVYVTHPILDKKYDKYNKWKNTIIKTLVDDGMCVNYFKTIQESINLWN